MREVILLNKSILAIGIILIFILSALAPMSLGSVIKTIPIMNETVSSDIINANFYKCEDWNYLPDDKLYPRGKIFPIGVLGGASPSEKQELSEAGFNCFNPYTDFSTIEELKEEVEEAASYGLFVILSKWGYPGSIESLIQNLSQYDNIAWWYMKEEQRWWRPEEMQYLQDFYNAVQTYDPQKRPCIEYIPGHYMASDIAHYVDRCELMFNGLYTDYAERSRIYVRWGVEQMIEGINQGGAPLDNVPMFSPQLFRYGSHETQPNEAYHDAWLGLVSGAKGMVIYTYNRKNELPSGVWESYKTVADQVSGNEKLGEVLLFGDTPQTIQVQIISGPSETPIFTDWWGNNYTYPSINWVQKSYNNRLYLIAVNSADSPVEIQVSNIDPSISQLKVMSENRTILIEGGNFFDIFETYDVHIYFSLSPPETPIISGETNGKAGNSYTYTFTSALDPDGDQVSYYIKWGDGSITDWTSFQPSGHPGYSESHTWSEQDEYTIEAKAKDTYGLESDWGEFKVTMPRNRILSNTLFMRFLEHFPILQLLLQRIQ